MTASLISTVDLVEVGAVSLCVAVLAVIAIVVLWIASKPSKAYSRIALVWGEPATLNGVPAVRPAREVRLRTRRSRLGLFVLFLVMASLFSVFAVLMADAGVRGSGHSATWQVLMLFVLVAAIAAMACGFWQVAAMALASLLNPGIELTASTSAPRAGEPFTVNWRVLGRCASLETLALTLTAAAEAPTGRSIAVERITTVQVAAAGAPEDVTLGRATVTVPGDAPPSLKAGDFKIVWEVAVHGRIRWPFRWWPDVRERFLIVVRPPRPLGGGV